MRLATRRSLGACVALALAGTLLAPPAAQAADAALNDPISLEIGHIDAFNLLLGSDESVTLALKEDATGYHVLREPESVDLVVKQTALTTFSDTALVPEGMPRTVYRLPLGQNQNLIWPGWDTNALVPAYGADASAEFAVTAVDGPGEVWLWTSDSWGDPVSLLDGGGFELTPSGRILQPYPAHTHAAWAFTEPGVYELTVRADVAGEGRTTSSNTAKYTFVVGPGVAVDGAQSGYAPGDPLQLQASTDSAIRGGGYEWYAQCGSDAAPVRIAGQNGPVLAVGDASPYIGGAITARLIGDAGTEIARSSEVEIAGEGGVCGITAGTPTISGTAQVGKKLTARPGSWQPSGVKLGYRWLRNGAAIPKATGSSYTPAAADAGKRISVRVTGALSGTPSVSATSAAKTAKRGKLTAPRPRISGTAKAGRTLTARTGSWKPRGVKLSYRWAANGKAIPKATKSSYRVAKKYRGTRITVKMTGKKAGYTTAARTSSPKRIR
ncbi:choice-of-anchor M domain-containing protein [Leucobacter weissii]|uniref:Choice-of-anchor M domain-containing protein n=1 Tax=Leucobacter weissii TaxID=1983706 RepID=A0A939SD34_9MICO|nr:choice-of-anchor M domain-containing protein [Leucobacter weissii]MBO1902968.1 choice-of-anchor M domain-containing protein [Leucobacter weissii]